MVAPVVSEDEFIRLHKELQSTIRVAEAIGVSVRSVVQRKRNIEKKHGIILPIHDPRPKYNTTRIDEKAISFLPIKEGTILIGSDAHIWPGERTIAQKAFVRFAKEFKPVAIIVNGDVFDGATISRHPSIGWENRPSVKDELDAVKDFLDDLLKASPNSKRLWPAGNHDLRFESRLSAVASEYKNVTGVHLKDHFPGWTPCWRVDINDDVVVKHRWHNGLHATHNNTLKSGKTIVTGHLHSLNVRPWTDYNGTRYGVDCGTLSEPYADQFIHYTEANPVNWRSGFVVLTFKGGRLLWPELVSKFSEDSVEFRGEVITV